MQEGACKASVCVRERMRMAPSFWLCSLLAQSRAKIFPRLLAILTMMMMKLMMLKMLKIRVLLPLVTIKVMKFMMILRVLLQMTGKR